MSDGRIALIDTEDASFDVVKTSPEIIFGPDRRLSNNPMDAQAQEWIKEQRKEIEEKMKGTKSVPWWSKEYQAKEQKTIPYNRQYDPKGINFKRALRARERVM